MDPMQTMQDFHQQQQQQGVNPQMHQMQPQPVAGAVGGAFVPAGMVPPAGMGAGGLAMQTPAHTESVLAFEEHTRKDRDKERRGEEHQKRVEEEQLQKRNKKLKRQKEHEERMQKAQEDKSRKKELRLLKVQEDKRKHAQVCRGKKLN